MYAALGGSEEIVKKLIAAGAEVGARNNLGLSALDIATQRAAPSLSLFLKNLFSPQRENPIAELLRLAGAQSPESHS